MTTPFTQTFTLTFGDQVENHVGMQKIGNLASEGFNLQDLILAKEWFEKKECKCKVYNLKDLIKNEDSYDLAQDAYILVIRKGLHTLLDPNTPDEFYNEQDKLEKDKKALMRGRVVNKRARHNLCFAEYNQEPNYEVGKGRIISFDSVPLLNKVRQRLQEVIGDKGKDLAVEGNYYYNLNSCGINLHGDYERRKVIGVRVGATFPLHFQWFLWSKPIGDRLKLSLNHGDIYIMSEKAVGHDWKKRKIPTLRHAAGSKQYLSIKNE